MNGSLDFTTSALESLAALALVMVVMAGVWVWLRRRQGLTGSGSKAGSIKVVASACLGLRKSICVVDVMGSLLVVAINRDDIRLLDRLDPTALDQGLPSTGPKGFAAHIKQMVGAGEGGPDA